MPLDHFGALNSRYGRTIGDAVLAEVALLLKLQVRESDVVARFEGAGAQFYGEVESEEKG